MNLMNFREEPNYSCFAKNQRLTFVDFSLVQPWHVISGFIIALITHHCYSLMDTCLSLGRIQEQFLVHCVFLHVSNK